MKQTAECMLKHPRSLRFMLQLICSLAENEDQSLSPSWYVCRVRFRALADHETNVINAVQSLHKNGVLKVLSK